MIVEYKYYRCNFVHNFPPRTDFVIESVRDLAKSDHILKSIMHKFRHTSQVFSKVSNTLIIRLDADYTPAASVHVCSRVTSLDPPTWRPAAEVELKIVLVAPARPA